MLSNRQKRLIEKRKESANDIKNLSEFRKVERYYKQKYPERDYSSLIDFIDQNSDLDNNIFEFELKLDTTLFGSRPNCGESKIVKAYYFLDCLGFIYIPNPFSVEKQKDLIIASLKEYTRAPNINNLDAHYKMPTIGIWKLYEDFTNNPTNISTIPLKVPLAPDNPAEQPEDDDRIKRAFEGYTYTGLNAKNEPIKNSKIQNNNVSDLVGRLRWTTLGYQYHWPTKTYLLDDQQQIPMLLQQLSRNVVDALRGFEFNYSDHMKTVLVTEDGASYRAEAGIVNYYQYGDSLMAHVDRSEPNLEPPLVSFSFGNEAVFLIGDHDINTKPLAFRVRSGDVSIMCGPARRAYHGVPRIIEDSLPDYLLNDDSMKWRIYREYISKARININIRQVVKFFHKNMFKLIKMLKTPVLRSVSIPTAVMSQTRFYGDHADLTKETIKERIFHLLKHYDKVDPTKLTDTAHFTNDLKLDSLDTVEVVMAIEEEFHIEIPDFDADEIKTVGDAIKYISLREDAN